MEMVFQKFRLHKRRNCVTVAIMSIDGANKRRSPIRGICAAAVALGCHRVHLAMVIRGERKSPKLLARYQKLHPKTI
jgi:hypothetical protein